MIGDNFNVLKALIRCSIQLIQFRHLSAVVFVYRFILYLSMSMVQFLPIMNIDALYRICWCWYNWVFHWCWGLSLIITLQTCLQVPVKLSCIYFCCQWNIASLYSLLASIFIYLYLTGFFLAVRSHCFTCMNYLRKLHRLCTVGRFCLHILVCAKQTCEVALLVWELFLFQINIFESVSIYDFSLLWMVAAGHLLAGTEVIVNHTVKGV